MMQQQAASLQHGGALFNYYRPPAAPTNTTRTPRQPVQHAPVHTNVSTGTNIHV
jgi:hypothetical protein